MLVVATWVPAAPPTGRHGPWHGMHGGYRLQATHAGACWGLAQAVAASYRGGRVLDRLSDRWVCVRAYR